MLRLKSIFAHGWAVLATPIVLATFLGLSPFSELLTSKLGLEISPRLSGGEISREIEHEGFRTVVRQPVFDGLLGPRESGFVQIEWLPTPGSSLPPKVEEEIDYDDDGHADFGVDLDTAANRATIAPHSARVVGLERIYHLQPERVIRVELRRE